MPIYLIALTSFVLFLSTRGGVLVLPALAAQLGADARGIAATLSSALMTLVLLQFFSGVLADRYGRRRVLYGLLGRLEPLLLLASVPASLALPVAWWVQDTRPLAVGLDQRC